MNVAGIEIVKAHTDIAKLAYKSFVIRIQTFAVGYGLLLLLLLLAVVVVDCSVTRSQIIFIRSINVLIWNSIVLRGKSTENRISEIMAQFTNGTAPSSMKLVCFSENHHMPLNCHTDAHISRQCAAGIFRETDSRRTRAGAHFRILAFHPYKTDKWPHCYASQSLISVRACVDHLEKPVGQYVVNSIDVHQLNEQTNIRRTKKKRRNKSK